MRKAVSRTSMISTLKKYLGKWVALTQDEKKILCSGDTVDEVLEKIRKQGDSSPLLVKIPDTATATFVF